MPFKSESQRKLMYAAASDKSGAGGVKQADAKKMVADDTGGKLPEKKSKGSVLYKKD